MDCDNTKGQYYLTDGKVMNMAKQKPYKLKSYSKKTGYRQNRSPLWYIIGTLAVVALVFVGISMYQPIISFLNGTNSDLTEGSDVSTPSSLPDTPSSSASGTIPDSSSSEPEPIPVQTLWNDWQTALVPFETASDPVAFAAFLDSLPDNYNSVLLEIKTAQGQVLFQSKNENALKWEAVTATALDLQTISNTLKQRNMHLAVKMSVFSDPIAARADISNAIMHTSGVLWLDNTAANGGKPWTTPYSEQVRQYNIDLAQEAADLGAEMIVLDQLQFPTDLTNSANVGGTGSVSRSEILSQFIQDMSSEVSGAKMVRMISALNLLTQDDPLNTTRYGGLPLGISGYETLMVDMRNITLAGENNTINPDSQKLLDEITQNYEIIPYIYAAQEPSLKNVNIEQYVIVNPA